ncbi:MAG TPA: uroporphyrinogen-III C-methyltransferase [Gemmatimonadaceae bacterium]|nr:uroporphyrinogen-III C-methyltransferase [Gemmatimonadaceae bacterium]
MTHRKPRPHGDGMVYLVGAGPGDPGLLTLRGGELLVTCDAIVYDALANPALLALAEATDREQPIELYDVGKRGGSGESARQDSINELLVRLAREGKRVVRLKGGDPFVFGRGSEEAEALAREGLRFEVVPGVTAGIAAPAYAGIPVTHRGVSTSVTFVTGHEDPAKESAGVDWSALARAGGTIVLYMGVKTLPRISQSLIAGGMSPATPAAAVQWGTYPRQRTVTATVGTLSEAIEREAISAPVITVIGPVVSLRETIAWFDRRPLFGKTIVVTRARSQSATLSGRLAALGADVVEIPATRIEPVESPEVAESIGHLSDYRWVIFTSQNAVGFFWSALRASGRDTRALAGIKVAAVGPATADALLDVGIATDLSPDRFVAEGLLDALRDRRDIRGARVLYAAAEGARDVLPEGLAELGASVDRVHLYRTVANTDGADELKRRIAAGVDLVTFTSASSVAAFADAVGHDAAAAVRGASIGPVTTSAARALGVDVVVEATDSTIPGLVSAVVDHFSQDASS